MPHESIQALVDTVRQAQTIELVIPDSTPGGKFWAPHQCSPTVKLSRVNKAELNKLPRKEVSPGSVPLRMELGDRFGSNRFRDVYRIHAASSIHDSSPPPHLAVKIVDLSFFSPSVPPTREWVEDIVALEYHHFRVLEPIQGGAVPLLAGLFGNGTLYCAIYEDAGRQLTWAERHNTEIGDRFLEAVRAVHAAGVAYGPDYPCSVCINDDGDIKIVDFEYAFTRETVTPEIIAQWNEDEDLAKKFAGWTMDQYMEDLCQQGCRQSMNWIGRYVPLFPSPTPSP